MTGRAALPPPPDSPLRVLLVDDEEGIRTVLSIPLVEAGYEVFTAASGRAALELFKAVQPSVVITDIKMPGMDGIALLREIKGLAAGAEVIITTGHGDLDLAIQSLRYGASDFITKPVDNDTLEIAISRAWEKIGLRRQVREHTENLERLVAEKSRQLVQAERMAAIGQTVAEMSHAIKNIAGGLEGAMYVLEQGLTQDNREYLAQGWEMIRRDVGRIKDLALDLLDYARPVEIRPRAHDPRDPAREVAALLSGRAARAGVVIVEEYDEAPDEAILDPEAVHSCLMNLVANGIEAVEDNAGAPGSPRGRVVLRIRRTRSSVEGYPGTVDGPGVEYQIEDDGPGMSEEVRRRLFQGFFTTKGSRGTGIGLMSVRKLTQEMGGEVRVDSAPGSGTRISLRIPCLRCPGEAPRRSAQP